jgi:hypothetical protein
MYECYMLGDLIFESTGKIVSQRVLSIENGIPKLEFTATGSGRTRGNTEMTETWTYWTIQRPDGTSAGEGQGMMMTRDGEAATATGRGEGKRDKSGKIRYPGVVFFATNSKDKLSFLNHMIGVNEYEVDEAGGYTFKCWEWK